MRVVEAIDLLNASRFATSESLVRAWEDIQEAVRLTDWPHGSGRFTINPIKDGNGVVPIKLPCLAELRRRGWRTERLPTVLNGVLGCGDLDALLNTVEGPVAFEWETGNISSSHRALNKLFLTSQVGNLLGSFLVVPSDALYKYLTQRVGNIRELRPYIPLWNTIIAEGGVRIVVVEHDATSSDVARIPKATDGRALR